MTVSWWPPPASAPTGRPRPRRFAPGLKLRRFGEGDREAALQTAGPFDVVICTYGLLPLEAERLRRVPWGTVVLDEGQNIKNAFTKRSQAVMDLQAGFRLVLSRHPGGEPPGRALEPLPLPQPRPPGHPGAVPAAVPGAHRARPGPRGPGARLRRLVAPFLLRRTKGQVLEELPPRTEIVLELEPSEAEAAFLEALRRASLEALEGGRRARPSRCWPPSCACAGPAATRTWSSPGSGHPLLQARGLPGTGGRPARERAPGPGLQPVRGPPGPAAPGPGRSRASPTSTWTAAPRPASAPRPSTPSRPGEGELFLISLKAGGTGLNLTGADYVIHMDPWWNPAVEDQATDRAHRIGQTRPVTVYRLVLKGTVEQKILALHAAQAPAGRGYPHRRGPWPPSSTPRPCWRC